MEMPYVSQEGEVDPMNLTPEAQAWLQENVFSDPNNVVDWGTYEIYDMWTGEKKGDVPRVIPRMY